VLLFCTGRGAGDTTRKRFSLRLATSNETIESKDDAEDTEEDLEKGNGDEVVESESLSVSGLDVIEEDREELLVMLGWTEAPPSLFLGKIAIQFFCNWLIWAVAESWSFLVRDSQQEPRVGERLKAQYHKGAA